MAEDATSRIQEIGVRIKARIDDSDSYAPTGRSPGRVETNESGTHPVSYVGPACRFGYEWADNVGIRVAHVKRFPRYEPSQSSAGKMPSSSPSLYFWSLKLMVAAPVSEYDGIFTSAVTLSSTGRAESVRYWKASATEPPSR